MRKKMLYRGVKTKTLNEYKKKGIPTNSNFSTNLFTARAHSSNGRIIEVPFSKTGFVMPQENNVLKRLKISERYYRNRKRIKRFRVMIST